MGVQFDTPNIVKYIYNKYPMPFGIVTAILVISLFSILKHEYEVFNPTILNVIDSIWSVFITVMTIGYGEISAISLLGRISMIIATTLGILFNSIFVVCGERMLRMTE